ncbi:MAG: hypothetical protein RL189_907 [Pseudomonadota bacterium]|jgi:micrococcal nuclease
MPRYKKRLISLSLAGAFGFFALLANNIQAGDKPALLASTAATQQPVESSSAMGATAVPTYTVISCNDGDTCRLRASDNTQVKVRLVGIDAPETGKKNRKKQKEGQSGGLEAKEFLNSLVVGKTVTLRSYGADHYGRNLAEIMVNNEPANLRMVAEGWAEVYRGRPPQGFDLSRYKTAQEEAVKNKKGIWSLQNYESPKDFRKRNKD